MTEKALTAICQMKQTYAHIPLTSDIRMVEVNQCFRFFFYCHNRCFFSFYQQWDFDKTFSIFWIRLFVQHAFCGTKVNNVDPDQTQQNVASDQGLHCLFT